MVYVQLIPSEPTVLLVFSSHDNSHCLVILHVTSLNLLREDITSPLAVHIMSEGDSQSSAVVGSPPIMDGSEFVLSNPHGGHEEDACVVIGDHNPADTSTGVDSLNGEILATDEISTVPEALASVKSLKVDTAKDKETTTSKSRGQMSTKPPATSKGDPPTPLVKKVPP